MTKILGLFAGAAVLFLLATAGFIGVVFTRGGVLISPGDLSTQGDIMLGGVSSHAELGDKCGACHVLSWSKETMADKCLSCHVSYYDELYDAESLHGILRNDYPEIDCASCHIEHNGSDAQLTVLNIERFPHEVTGFSLQSHLSAQKDTALDCSTCHQERVTLMEQGTCAECHMAQNAETMGDHILAFGLDCISCHDGLETYGKDFDHADVFKLIGNHQEAACSSCHAGATSLEMLKATTQNCADCHVDEHVGELSQNCAFCHSPEGWDQMVFDHDMTPFPLVGKHQMVNCQECHSGATFAGLEPSCANCHLSLSPHPEAFGSDCGSCHSPVGWAEVTFDHQVVDTSDCQTCHSQDRPAVHYPGNCASCHSPAGWLPASFDHSVAGAVDCQGCHINNRPVNHFQMQCSACHQTSGWLPATFNHTAVGATDCQSCHSRPSGHYSGQCSACHANSGWLPASFNHAAAGATNCQACHAPPGNHYGTSCSSCHSPGSWGFSHGPGTDCQSCHSRPSEHSSGQCSQCHNTSHFGDADDDGEEEEEKDDD